MFRIKSDHNASGGIAPESASCRGARSPRFLSLVAATLGIVLAGVVGSVRAVDKPAADNATRAKPTTTAAAGEKQPDPGALFDRLDTNHDGILSGDELKGEKRPFLDRLLRTADGNKDGKISREEFVAGMQKSGDREAGKASRPRPSFSDGPDGQRRFDPTAIFQRLDKNGDGKVTADEMPQEHRERFMKLLKNGDKNGDKALDKEEFLAAFKQMAPGRSAKDSSGKPAKSGKFTKSADKSAASAGKGDRAGRGPEAILEHMLKEHDKNGDGKLSKDELSEHMREHFDKIDKNHDGFLDQSELKQMLERMKQRRAERAGKVDKSKP